MTTEEYKLLQQIKNLTDQVEKLSLAMDRAKRKRFIGTIVFSILGAVIGTLCLRLLV